MTIQHHLLQSFSDTTDNTFSIVVKDVPTFNTILTTNSVNSTSRNLAILIDWTTIQNHLVLEHLLLI